jgi:putative glutamine amidotransferase
VAFLFGQDGEFFTIDFNYAYAIAKTGVVIVFLDYTHCVAMMNGCHGLILPGGAFVSPKQYYQADDPVQENAESTSVRAEAYRSSYHQALIMGISILGICAGMQMIAGELGCFLSSSVSDKLGSSIAHKTTVMEAHEIEIVAGTLLYSLVKVKKLKVNSRYKEYVSAINNLIAINAVATDGCLEAFEVAEEGANILGIQWHPEDYVVKGDERHFAIYKWLADEARRFMTKSS